MTTRAFPAKAPDPKRSERGQACQGRKGRAPLFRMDGESEDLLPQDRDPIPEHLL